MMNRLVQMNSGTEKCWGEGDVVLFSGVFLGGKWGRKGVQLGRAALLAGFVTVDSPYAHFSTLLIELTGFWWNFL